MTQEPHPGCSEGRLDRGLLILALASVVGSLVVRVWFRGVDVPGWDLLLTVEGQNLLATRGLWAALRETLVEVRTFWLPPAAYSVPYGLVPGALTLWWPGLFWQPLVVFLAWMATLALLLVAMGWPLRSARGWTLALLAWDASPALLSYALEGYPWGAGMLPHALALAIVFARSFRRWWVTLPALALVWELPWHGYELGKTAGMTLLLAAALAPEAEWFRRLAWAVTGVTQQVAVVWLWPSSNIIAFGRGNRGAGVGLFHAWPFLPEGAARLARAMTGNPPLIVPILAVAGVLALRWAGPARSVLVATWAFQLGLVLLLAAGQQGGGGSPAGEAVPARRWFQRGGRARRREEREGFGPRAAAHAAPGRQRVGALGSRPLRHGAARAECLHTAGRLLGRKRWAR